MSSGFRPPTSDLRCLTSGRGASRGWVVTGWKPVLRTLRDVFRGSIAVLLCVLLSGGNVAYADILRGAAGRSGSPAARPAEGTQASPGADVAAANRQRAQDRLSRTTQAVNALRNAQQAAQARSQAAARSAGGSVPDGLRPGGLVRAEGENARWVGALDPQQSGRNVNIKQTDATAVLHWETFNVGRRTTVNFDQSAGGVDAGKWVAFNRVLDPSGKPSRILGNIRADGQVYIVNQNGIIFGAGSQVNARSLVASSLPINENLIQRGLLNQTAANPEFLFSAVQTGNFVPPAALTPSGNSGNIIVEEGARLFAPPTAEGSGGRIMLIGANIENRGIISTPSGQTVLAAGRQVGFEAHPASDPSLRGLDVFIGAVGDKEGSVTNRGIIEIPTGNATLIGREVNQFGAIDSTTSVTLNGRIDLIAAYDSVPNIEYNPALLGGAAPFLPRTTGDVNLGRNSVTRILPDLLSEATTVGTALPIRSQINMTGRNIHFGDGAMVQAPSGDVNLRAGIFRPVQFSTAGDIRGSRQAPDFAFSAGQVYVDPGAFIDVAGSMDVFIPLANSIFEVRFLGAELAVSPLQRDGVLRGLGLVIDTRVTGTFNGRQWVGTPLADASGFLNLIERNAAQLTADGGNVRIESGGPVVLREGSVIDVSGGFFRNEGGQIATSRLLSNGRLVNIEDATPDRIYQGIYHGRSQQVSERWGVVKNFVHPLALDYARTDAESITGANGGTLSIIAPAMALDGELLAHTVVGARQVRETPTSSTLPGHSTLNLTFKFQDPQEFATGLLFPDRSPTPPEIIFGTNERALPVAAYNADPESEEPILGEDRLERLLFAKNFYEKTGFGRITIENADGDFRFPGGNDLVIPERGGLQVTGRNIFLEGNIRGPAAQLAFTAYNISPFEAVILRSDPVVEMPEIVPENGTILLGSNATLDVSGYRIDGRFEGMERSLRPIVLEGGQVRLTGYNLDLLPGSVIDVSGGAFLPANNPRALRFGSAGAITLEAGQDPNLRSILGGFLTFGAQLRGFSGAEGGTLSIRAPRIQIGGVAQEPETLALTNAFFGSGGFTRYNLTGIGAIPFVPPPNPDLPPPPVDPDAPDEFIPGVVFMPGTTINARSQGLVLSRRIGPDGRFELDERILPDGERRPISYTFSAPGVTADFVNLEENISRGSLLVRGDIVMPENARILTDPGALVSFNAQTVTLGGQIRTPGGRIEVVGGNAFPLSAAAANAGVAFARPTVHLTPSAILSTAGTSVLLPDPFGRRAALIFPGGSIAVSGNIVAEAGAVLNVSGASEQVDVHPSRLGLMFANQVSPTAGLTSAPFARLAVRTRIDSDAGSISLAGSQMLLSDATLIGRAGGPTGLGGTLSISSGRFYEPAAVLRGSDINLVVSQNGRVIPFQNKQIGVGRPIRDADENIIPGIGFFNLDRFIAGEFDSLDLGFAPSNSGVTRGGNIEFVGPVSLSARGFIRLASGGIIRSDSDVSIQAPYVALGQEFRPPVNPGDERFVPFSFVDTVSTGQEFVQPETGKGRLRVSADLIDVGTLVLKQIGTASFEADGGDIRGNGTLAIQGNLSLRAAQIYPNTLAEFNIFAYDTPERAGNITIARSGNAQAPLSAGGSLNIYASNIFHSGNLVAPFGSITIGWDGNDLDPFTDGIQRPINPVTGTALPIPVTNKILIASGSSTSVAGIDGQTGAELLIPFGVSPDALSIIDPRGVDITATGLPQKRVSIAGENVVNQAGSIIDIRGGGELYAYRFIPGRGGPIDILGVSNTEFRNDITYQGGDLVSFRNPRTGLVETYAARLNLAPSDFASNRVPTPSVSEFWTFVPDSFAVVPGFDSRFAPRARFNTGSAAGALQGDPGYLPVAGSRIGDQIRIDAGTELAAGTYTLLPRRYALLPGAFLVTPQNGDRISNITLPEGNAFTSGTRINALNRARQTTGLRGVIEVQPASVFLNRAQYELYGVSDFVTRAAARLDIQTIQERPVDSGYLSLHGNSALELRGTVRARPVGLGRGGTVDISSFADIVVGTTSMPREEGTVALDTRVLNRFGAESLMIGGIRRDTATGMQVETRTSNLTLDNRGRALIGNDLILTSRETLTLAAGSRIAGGGAMTGPADVLRFGGDGVVVRASGDPRASIVRVGDALGTTALLTVEQGARVSGVGLVLDSTYGFLLDPSARISAEVLRLGAGQISVVMPGFDGELEGQQFDTQLVLAGDALRGIQSVDSLRLVTYRDGIDFYGEGVLGGSRLSRLEFATGGIRGFGHGEGGPVVRARELLFENPRELAAPTAPLSLGGTIAFNSRETTFGSGEFSVSGFSNVLVGSRNGVRFDGLGRFTTPGNLTLTTPILAVTQGADHGLVAAGDLDILRSERPGTLRSELGGGLLLQGASTFVGSDVSVPSGSLEVRATSGDVVIAGSLNAAGQVLRFFDTLQFTDAGEIRLVSELGNVLLTEDSTISVASASGGGNAGSIVISAENGVFEALGSFSGASSGLGRGGSFELDTRELFSFAELSQLLDLGGFTESRDLRIRTGDIFVTGSTSVRNFSLSADGGSIIVSGSIFAGGRTGGRIDLIARDNVVLESGSVLSTAAEIFDNAGKGGSILLEAGAAINGVSNVAATVDIQEGSLIDLSVAEYVPGLYTEIGSSAFYGAFQGTLHLRAPRNLANDDLGINTIEGTIVGASSILAEGYNIIDLTATGGLITGWRTAIGALPAVGTVQREVHDSATAFLSDANYAAMMARILGADAQGLSDVFVLAPGVEIINRNGNLTLGLTNEQIVALVPPSSTVAVTGLGSAQVNSADWNLSDFRFGPQGAPGVLTLRASGNLVFNNALSDGFSPIAATATNANSPLWLGQVQDIDLRRPANTQSWSFRMTAGADLGAASSAQTLAARNLASGAGSIFVGELYDLVPNTGTTGATAGIGANGLTANSLRIFITQAGQIRERGTRFEVIRTGTGSITTNAARDIQFRNPFATIYTAGVRIPTAQISNVYGTNDFRPPTFFFSNQPPDALGTGVPQQNYGPAFSDETGVTRRTGQWTLAGGNISLRAGNDINRVARVGGQVVASSVRQVPTNWLMRRGFVDPNTGLFGSLQSDSLGALVDPIASTAWWVDFSNFFQGVGALGGGNVEMIARRDIANVDAVSVTNARMSGRDAEGNAIAPDANNLLELGGGDLTVRAGRNIDGGFYYVERGDGVLSAQGAITTNRTRSPSFGNFTSSQTFLDSATWLPTTLFVGKGGFEVTARQDVLLGPVLNAFLLPQGLQNRDWYRTYFSTYAPDSYLDVRSFGGSVTHRIFATVPASTAAQPIFQLWLQSQNRFDSTSVSPSNPQGDSSAFFQPWARLTVRDQGPFGTVTTVLPPILRSAAFGGDLNVVGSINLSPSPVGDLQLLTSGQFIGLQRSGLGRTPLNEPINAFITARINLSDASPSRIAGVATPTGRSIGFNFLGSIFDETGSITGVAASAPFQQTLHDPGVLHRDNTQPARIYVLGGDLEGLTLYSPKLTRVLAQRDITNIAFYLQHAFDESISIVSAGRDLIPSNSNAPNTIVANDRRRGNFVIDQPQTTTILQGNSFVTTTALSGDIQLGGRGVLEVFAGRTIDLGTGPNLLDGRGVGITTIGRNRNPFLPFDGASILMLAGVGGRTGGPAPGLVGSDLNLDPLMTEGIMQALLGSSREHQAIGAFRNIFRVLRESGSNFGEVGNYDAAFGLLEEVFGGVSRTGEIFTRSRDIRTTSGGSITIAVPVGGLTMASDITGNPLTPPGIVTEFGGTVDILVNNSLDIGQARIFTLRGGDLTIWSSTGDIAAGSAPRTVVTAPPTRVVIDTNSADVVTDLGGLATGGGIGVLAAVAGVEPGAVTLIAPQGTVDAGDAGIRATGDITIAAVQVLNADNISAGGTSVGVPTAPVAAAPNIGGLSSASNAAASATASATEFAQQVQPTAEVVEEAPSVFTVEILGYGGSEDDEDI